MAVAVGIVVGVGVLASLVALLGSPRRYRPDDHGGGRFDLEGSKRFWK